MGARGLRPTRNDVARGLTAELYIKTRKQCICEGDRAYVAAKPEIPLSVTSAKDFWQHIDQAQADIAAGRLVDAASLSEKLRAL